MCGHTYVVDITDKVNEYKGKSKLTSAMYNASKKRGILRAWKEKNAWKWVSRGQLLKALNGNDTISLRRGFKDRFSLKTRPKRFSTLENL